MQIVDSKIVKWYREHLPVGDNGEDDGFNPSILPILKKAKIRSTSFKQIIRDRRKSL